jgi:hypothetical protein
MKFIKIRPVKAEFFGVDGRTDVQTHMTELLVDFCNFENALNERTGEIIKK